MKNDDKNQRSGFQEALEIIGYAAIKILKFIPNLIVSIIRSIVKNIAKIAKGTGKAAKNAARASANSVSEDIAYAENIRKEVSSKKYEGGKKYADAVIDGSGELLFGSRGFLSRFIRFLIPVLCILFLVAVVNYGRQINYGIEIRCNGVNCGTVASEDVCREAVEIAKKRINYGDSDNEFKVAASERLKAYDKNALFISAQTLADNIIKSSGNEVAECYGIFVNENFVGAVENTDYIKNALDKRLANYNTVGGGAHDIKYRDAISFEKGLYLRSSMLNNEQMRTKLFAETKQREIYYAKNQDTLQNIAANYNMTLDEIKKMNPGIDSSTSLGRGTVVYVLRTQSFLPIEYSRTIEESKYISYTTKKIGSVSLPVGTTKILIKGKRGEKLNTVKVTYIDGIPEYREIENSRLLESPVTETIGVGTYMASPQTGLLSGTGQFMWPVDGGSISSGFLQRPNHEGLDIAADAGTPIYAAEGGTVEIAGFNEGGYGNTIMIDHGNDYETLYAHCMAIVVKSGDTVVRGQLIGYVGATGNATGNHLHFEVRYNGVCYNPELFINTEKDSKPQETLNSGAYQGSGFAAATSQTTTTIANR